MKHILLLSVIASFSCIAQAQTALVKGSVNHKQTGNPIPEIEVTLPKLKMMKVTEADGSFKFSQVPFGNYDLVISSSSNKKDTLSISVSQEVVDLGSLELAIDEAASSIVNSQAATISLEESAISADDEGMSDQSISSVLTASRDPYLNAAAFSFGPLRYQIRGYKRDQQEVYMNGLPMNDAESGSAFFSQWGGLNDVFRNQVVTFGLAPAEVGFGGLIGATQIEATAADQRKQTRITYSLSNRTYRNRLMLTHSSGLMPSGWAYSFSVSKRWGKEGYIPGTFYDGYSYYAAVSKKLNAVNSLHLTVFGTPTSRGKAMPATQEAMDLAGSNYYNPNWGYQDGEKRNARVNNSHQPAAILTFKNNPDNSTQWNTSLGFQTGFNGNTSLDWYNAMDPRPDYYRNLPSYYLYDPRGTDSAQAAAQRDYLMADPDTRMQVNWGRMYDANRMNLQTINGVTGKRSVYIVGEDVDQIRKYMLSSTYQKVVNSHVKVIGGIAGIIQNTESFRRVNDLLGGDYYVNLNQFAERDFAGNEQFNQNDLNNPYGIVREGDRYNYNYKAFFQRYYGWAQGEFTYNKVDFFLTARLGNESFQREGLFRNGLFADDSYGKSEKFNFLTYAAKGGVTYKIDGRNYLFVNGGIMTAAPTFDNTFISPRMRNTSLTKPLVEKITTLDGGYLLRSPFINGRLSGFVTEFRDLTDIKRFYHEDFRTFVNYVMQNVNIRNLGAEFAMRAKISPSLTASAVATWMQVFYTERPNVAVYVDNDTSKTARPSQVYIKDYFVASGPQSAYTVGLNYSSPNYWYANINFNYLDRNYMDFNPTRRTAEAVEFLEPGSEQWHRILDQEKLPSFYTIDLFGGTSVKLNKYIKGVSNDTYLYINIGINNILNNKNIITGGFEQLRYDYATQNPERFPSKYFYGFGTNYFVNLSLKF